MTGEMNEVDKEEYADWFNLAKEIREKTHVKAEVKPSDTTADPDPFVHVPKYRLKVGLDGEGFWGKRQKRGRKYHYMDIGTTEAVVRYINALKRKRKQMVEV